MSMVGNCEMSEALLQGSEEASEQPLLTVIVRGPDPQGEESELYVGLRDARRWPAELVQEDGDACTLAPETLADALSFARPGPGAVNKVLRLRAWPSPKLLARPAAAAAGAAEDVQAPTEPQKPAEQRHASSPRPSAIAPSVCADAARMQALVPVAKTFRISMPERAAQPKLAAPCEQRAPVTKTFRRAPAVAEPKPAPLPKEASGVQVAKTFRRAPPAARAKATAEASPEEPPRPEEKAAPAPQQEEKGDREAELESTCKALREELSSAKAEQEAQAEHARDLALTLIALKEDLLLLQERVQHCDSLESKCRSLQAEVSAAQGKAERSEELESTCEALRAEVAAAQEGARRAQEFQSMCEVLEQELALAQEREVLALEVAEDAKAEAKREKELAGAGSEGKDQEAAALAAACERLRGELAEARDRLVQAVRREAAAQRQAEADRANLSAVVASCSPLVLDVDAREETALRGDASDRLAPLLKGQKASSVFCVGCAHFPTSTDEASLPACASVVLRNDGREEWPETTAVVFAAGDSFGLPLVALGKVAPGELAEVVLDLLVPPRSKPGQAQGAWAVVDAATGRRLGPLLVLEAIWDAPPPA